MTSVSNLWKYYGYTYTLTINILSYKVNMRGGFNLYGKKGSTFNTGRQNSSAIINIHTQEVFTVFDFQLMIFKFELIIKKN